MTATPFADAAALSSFIGRWSASGAAERANYQLFLAELCDVLEVPRPEPTQPDDAVNAYVFERAVTFHHADGSTSSGRIDLYRRGSFVLEAKQGVERAETAQPLSNAGSARAKAARKGTATRGTAAWDVAMVAARGQGENYIRALPASEGRPPFLLVVDVGHTVELYAEFTRTGGAYVPFPDPRTHRIALGDLARPEIRERLRAVWLDPLSLDPSRRSARVTREIATKLGRLAQLLERAGHAPDLVAGFLMRALFTMFAEDIELLPRACFLAWLQDLRAKDRKLLVPALEDLWSKMNTGGFYAGFQEHLLRFNGGLFANPVALPLDDDQFDLLIEAASADWRDVEPAIFGTLLERALDPIERHKLGAHYTPRAYVERLVVPTIVEPLRAEWDAARAAALTQERVGKAAEAAKEIRRFLTRLCEVRVLDPACGSGNFLYVTLEHLKRLEGEVLDVLRQFGESDRLELKGVTVDPHQLLGIEINPRAAAIAELVLWIGYLQWHFRTRGNVAPPEPVIKNFKNIECRDAVLAHDGATPMFGPTGDPVTRWDGKTTKAHAVTGEQVPDAAAQVSILRYENPRPAEWPKANFIVGNPPFVGNKLMRESLGDGYVDALRAAYADVPDSVDFVMYWWHRAAESARRAETGRFGFITRNSITQKFNRRVVQLHCEGQPALRIDYAIPNHPWVDSADGAQVRIAMTVCDLMDRGMGRLTTVDRESSAGRDEIDVHLTEVRGRVQSDLSVGPDLLAMAPLQANRGLACPGVQLSGQGFVIDARARNEFGEAAQREIIRGYLTGRDLMQSRREQYVLDTGSLGHDELLNGYPDVYQHLHDHVLGPRRAKAGQTKDSQDYAKNWWRMAKPRTEFRKAFIGLDRFIISSRTSRHRVFCFCPAGYLPETKILIVALRESWQLAVLSSRVHVLFATRRGGWHGVGNDPTYNHTDCFDPFPFPETTDHQKATLDALAGRLERHRTTRQAECPGLVLTDMYNVLSKVREGEPLDAKELVIHQHGLVTVLSEIHDQLDAAVLGAYGWPLDISDDEILTRLCALNAERAAEERRGLVRWLRPEFQNKTTAQQEALDVDEDAPRKSKGAKASKKPAATKPEPWPPGLAEQARAVRAALTAAAAPVAAATLSKSFKGAKSARVAELLETLASLGQARALPGRLFVGG
jgi:SAM-dependent methyltransferase